MEIIDRLKYLRKVKLKLSQEEFGAKINLSKSNISNIEIGRVKLTDRNLSDICSTFNVNEDWLRFGSGGEENIFIPEDMQYLFSSEKLQMAPDDFKECVLGAVKNLPDEYWDILYSEFLRIAEKKQG